MANKSDYVELELACADVHKALYQGMDGKKLVDLSQSVREAIEQPTRLVASGVCIVHDPLTTPNRSTVAEIQADVVGKGERRLFSRLVHAKNDKETIAAWKLDLNRILHVFNVRLVDFTWLSPMVSFQAELVINIHVAVSGIRHDASEILEEICGRVRSVSASRIQSIDNRRVLTAYVESHPHHHRGLVLDVTS